MITPCDYLKDEDGMSICPYESVSESERCRVCCALGVDEDPYPDEEDYDPYCDPEC